MSRAVLTVVDIKITLFWDVNSCCLVTGTTYQINLLPHHHHLKQQIRKFKAAEPQVSVKCR